MMTLTNGNAAVIIDNWRCDHEFVIIASSNIKLFVCLQLKAQCVSFICNAFV